MSVLANQDWGATGAHSGNWTDVVNNSAFNVLSGAARFQADPCCAYWNPVTPPANQYAQATLGTMIGGTDGAGPAIRISTSQNTQYAATASTVEVIILKVVNDAYAAIGATAGPATSGDVIYIEAQGTAIIVKKNGTTIISTTDSGIASGRFGIWGSDDGVTFPTLTAWSAGDFLTAGGIIERRIMRQLGEECLATW